MNALEVALAIAVRGGRVLVGRRPAGDLVGFWEFPGGKIVPGESATDAARRELVEETGLVAGELEPLALFVHDYPERSIRFHVFLARDPEGNLGYDGTASWSWKGLAELDELRMPPANGPMLRALRWRLEG